MMNSTRGVVLLFLGTVAAWSVLWAISEGGSLIDGAYWTITTMTTVGYGDMSPETAHGKVMTSLLMLWSVFGLVPVIVGNIVTKVLVDPDQWTHEEQEHLMAMLADIHGSVRHDAQ